jgi:acyl-CoA thioester hydrolase
VSKERPDMTGTPDKHSMFTWPVRVYYEDTDTGGVVFYANYLKFFERARTEWLRSIGFEQQKLAVEDNTIFVVRNTAVDYMSPARLDDQLEITVNIEKIGRASVSFMQEAWRIGETPVLIARGAITIACIDTVRFRPQSIPSEMLHLMRVSL